MNACALAKLERHRLPVSCLDAKINPVGAIAERVLFESSGSMSNLSLNQSLSEVVDDLDFERALKRVKYDARYDFIRLPTEIAVFEAHYQENVRYLQESIKQGTYEIKNLRRI